MSHNKNKKKFSPLNTILGLTVMAIAGKAIKDQLDLPPQYRTWHGNVLGIPYDFRRPTPEKIRSTFWNEHSSLLFVPQVFGIGWTINFYPLLNPPRRLEE